MPSNRPKWKTASWRSWIIRPGNLKRIVHGTFHLDTEPVIDAAGEVATGGKEEQERRNERETDKRGHELCPKTGTDEPLASFKIKFDQVTGQEQAEKDSQDRVHIDQGHDQNIRREGGGPFHPSEEEEGQCQTDDEASGCDQNAQ